jgi:beta-mannanase
MNAVTTFEAQTGKPLSLVSFAAPFANCFSTPCTYYKFDANAFNKVRSHGAIPFFSWASQSLPSSVNEPNFQLSDVSAGNYDDFIRQWATSAKAWGSPFFLRFNFEMNGNWFPWSEGVNGNQTGDYVAAWRHVHDIFTAVGATNASWVWCPNVDPKKMWTPLAGLYPGDAYVDWTCLDGYNWGPTKGGWVSFDWLYQSTYQTITTSIAPSKPMIIGEIGSTENGGSKAAWISDMFSRLPAYPKIRGFVWEDSNVDSMDWPIESSATSQTTFANGVHDARYQANAFTNLGMTKVPVPPG